MPRANRHYIPGYVWHITHRCHKKEFLLKFARDRRRWLWWLFEARKRYGLCVLNYAITSNHIHLLVRDKSQNDVIPKSIQLIAGRTGQEFNQRKGRKGAYWEDCYHATAVETDEHLAKCMVYIDLNMVRAGVVNHPSEYEFCGYNEIQKPRQRYALIDYEELTGLLGFKNMVFLSSKYKGWIDEAMKINIISREGKWSESIAVGSEGFIQQTRDHLGYRAIGRKVHGKDGTFELRESIAPYNGIFEPENGSLKLINGFAWNDFTVKTI
jgi:putative transposase